MQPSHFFPSVVTMSAFPRLRSIAVMLVTLVCVLSLYPSQAQAQRADCVIASNDGRNGFRTDEITRCRINTGNGRASFVMKQKERDRSYISIEPLEHKHLDVANYWLKRSDQLQFQSRYNPAGFDIRAFLKAASQATKGYALTRKKRGGGQAVNIVYFTDGVYRSIDFDGTNLREVPSGFLTTGL